MWEGESERNVYWRKIGKTGKREKVTVDMRVKVIDTDGRERGREIVVEINGERERKKRRKRREILRQRERVKLRKRREVLRQREKKKAVERRNERKRDVERRREIPRGEKEGYWERV